jgi:tetrapyrrole methylase family protein/MazG family protein
MDEKTTGPERKNAASALNELLDVIRILRSPERGCPWDMCQSRQDVAKYLLEEAHEVLDAVYGGTAADLQEELGDLLFQILFLSRIAEESAEFEAADVISGITRKMIRRHEHVFGGKKVRDIGEVRNNWEKIKREVEKKEAGGTMSRISPSLPSLMRAQKITDEASRVGFDWTDARDVLAKIEEETGELREALTAGAKEQIEGEIGDILLSVVNLSRLAGVDAEGALRSSLLKFIRRFEHIEKRLKERGLTPEEAGLEEMDRLWEESKSGERK